MRLCLGTVQFGMRYGIANRVGQVDALEAGAILRCANAAGIDMLDTAIAYGDSERTLGNSGVSDWKVVTKLPPLPGSEARGQDVRAWVHRCVAESLQRLGVSRLYGLLLHRPADLLEQNGSDIHAAMAELKARGTVSRIGVSIYDPQELAPLFERYSLDMVQAPFNVLDRRLERSGWLERLRSRRIELHTRSAFLQGLLLMDAAARPQYFGRWSVVLGRWSRWLEETSIDAVTASLNFVLARTAVDRVVVGVDSVAHLEQLINAVRQPLPLDVPDVSSDDLDLLNPSRWPKA